MKQICPNANNNEKADNNANQNHNDNVLIICKKDFIKDIL